MYMPARFEVMVRVVGRGVRHEGVGASEVIRPGQHAGVRRPRDVVVKLGVVEASCVAVPPRLERTKAKR